MHSNQVTLPGSGHEDQGGSVKLVPGPNPTEISKSGSTEGLNFPAEL